MMIALAVVGVCVAFGLPFAAACGIASWCEFDSVGWVVSLIAAFLLSVFFGVWAMDLTGVFDETCPDNQWSVSKTVGKSTVTKCMTDQEMGFHG